MGDSSVQAGSHLPPFPGTMGFPSHVLTNALVLAPISVPGVVGHGMASGLPHPDLEGPSPNPC